MKENVFDSHKFKLWQRHLQRNGLQINNVEHIYTRHNHKGEVLFALLMLDATDPTGHKIPPICFLKGEVVCVLVCLIDEQTQQKYQLLVKQRRICDGSLTYEHPAGMLDSESDAAKVAAREVWEETGIEVQESQLVRLLDFAAHPSSGTSDEAMYYFYCEISLPLSRILAYNEQHFGEASEHERIITEVLPFVEGHRRITNVNGILLDFLYLKAVGDWELIRQL